MKYLLSPACREELRTFLSQDPLIVLDFDGTLAPITADPRRATPRPSTRELLDRLASLRPVAVLSGRARADVRVRLGAEVRWVVGNHGAAGLPDWQPDPGLPERVGRWEDALQRALRGIQGLRIENKQLSLAVHFRGTREQALVRARIRKAVATLPGASVREGHRVFDVLALGQPDKGDAVQRLLRAAGRRHALIVGDDATDEDAFRLAGPHVMAVRVGASAASHAPHYVRGQREVDELLRIACENPVRPSSATGLPVALEFLQLLWAVDHGMRSASKAMEVRLGISGPQRLVLRLVEENPGISAGEVARGLRRDPSTLTPVLAQLERSGLLRRERDPRDARRMRLVLAPAGLRARGDSAGTIESAVRVAMHGLRPETLVGARLFLSSVVAALEASELTQPAPRPRRMTPRPSPRKAPRKEARG